MRIPEVDQALAECKLHLDQDGGRFRGTPIERYLIEYLLVVICGSFEQELKKTLVECVKKSRNRKFESFVQVSVDNHFTMKIGTTRKYIKAFGGKVADAFETSLQVDPQIESHYSSLVTNRHDVAHHRKTITLSMNDIEQYYSKAHLVLDAVKAAFA